MINHDQEQPLTEAELIAEQKEIRESLNYQVKLGKALDKLRNDNNFKLVFETVFLKEGLDILWQNTRNLKEAQLIGQGSDKNLEILAMLESQVKTRLDFRGFMDTIEHDKENAESELYEMDQEETDKFLEESLKSGEAK